MTVIRADIKNDRKYSPVIIQNLIKLNILKSQNILDKWACIVFCS